MNQNLCNHCYCEDILVGFVPHKKCCNCGNKQKKSNSNTPWNTGTGAMGPPPWVVTSVTGEANTCYAA